MKRRGKTWLEWKAAGMGLAGVALMMAGCSKPQPARPLALPDVPVKHNVMVGPRADVDRRDKQAVPRKPSGARPTEVPDDSELRSGRGAKVVPGQSTAAGEDGNEIHTRTPAFTTGLSAEDAQVSQDHALRSATQSQSPSRTASEIFSNYLVTEDEDTRSALISELGTLPASEGVQMLGAVFDHEKSPTLQAEAVSSLIDLEGPNNAKLGLLIRATKRERAEQVRQAAADVLENLDDVAGVAAVWQILLTDPLPEIRDQAREALERLRAQKEGEAAAKEAP